ncbi:MAG: DnaJ domain-containing protein [Spirochaetota bacterium]
MEIQDALHLLELDHNYTLKDLNLSFRRLAKRYHPDSNRGKESWAHRMMTQLNQAYEMAALHLTSSARQARISVQEKYRRVFQGRFNQAMNHILQGIYTYYQYGLENVHLRKEGIRRIRYRDSLKHLCRGIEEMESLRHGASTENQIKNLDTFTEFSKAFYRNMLIQKSHRPGSTYENKAYPHYYHASLDLDYAIKDVFFGDMLIQVRNGSFYQRLRQSHQQYMMVISKYYQSSWVSETVLKMYLLELFSRVVELLKEMRY